MLFIGIGRCISRFVFGLFGVVIVSCLGFMLISGCGICVNGVLGF